MEFKMKIKEVKSPCRLIYTMKSVLDGLGDSTSASTKIKIVLPAKNINIESLVERYSRAIYGYYGNVTKENNKKLFLIFSKDDRVKYQSTIIYYEDNNIIAELVTFKRFSEDSINIM